MKGSNLLRLVIYFILIQVNGSLGNHHRSRRFIFTQNSQVSFDVDLTIPIPMLGSIDVMAVIEIPLTVTMLNDTFTWNPISLPYFVMPAPEPLPYPAAFPQYPYSPDQAAYMPQQQVPYMPQQAYPSAAMRRDSSQQQQNANQYFHHQMKRSTAAAAAQHRYDLFSSLSSSISELGYDGKACICKSICQLAQAPLLIEHPLHELLEHILTVSRAHDEENMLQEYSEAENYGLSQNNCTEKYKNCGISFFLLFDD